MPPEPSPRRRRERAALALLLSLLLHVAGIFLLRASVGPAVIDFELALPSEVELGMTEATAVEPLAAPEPAQNAEPAPAEPETAEATPEQAQATVQRDAGPAADAGEPDEKDKTDAAARDAGAPDAGASPNDAGADAATGDAGDAGEPLLAAYAPKGAQIALRLHLARLRASPLAEDVARLLSAIPDWRLILEGSGIDPLEHLEKIFIASPNLRRSSMVIAGQYRGSDKIARRAVAHLANEQGTAAHWRRRHGIAVAPWRNRDATERVIALIAPQQFVIAPPDDLPRVLSIAQALAARAHDKTDAGTTPSAGDALLALEEGQTLGLSVEGARQFARGNMRGVPERFDARVIHPERGPLEVRVEGTYESPDAAKQAKAYWQSVQRRVASSAIVAFIGARRPVSDATLDTDGTQLRVETRVTVTQARMLLGFLQNLLSPPKTSSGAPNAPGAKPGPARVPVPPPPPVAPPRNPTK